MIIFVIRRRRPIHSKGSKGSKGSKLSKDEKDEKDEKYKNELFISGSLGEMPGGGDQSTGLKRQGVIKYARSVASTSDIASRSINGRALPGRATTRAFSLARSSTT